MGSPEQNETTHGGSWGWGVHSNPSGPMDYCPSSTIFETICSCFSHIWNISGTYWGEKIDKCTHIYAIFLHSSSSSSSITKSAASSVVGTPPPSLHLSLSRSLEGILKQPWETYRSNPAKLHVTHSTLCTVEPLYLFPSLKCLNRGRVRNIGAEIPWRWSLPECFMSSVGSFYCHP